jgi:hypothetical protein
LFRFLPQFVKLFLNHPFFCPADTGESILYITKDYRQEAMPNIFSYLKKHKSLLIQKSVEKRTGKRDWPILFRGRYEALFNKPKILIRQTGDHIVAAIDKHTGYFCIDSVNVAQVKIEHHNKLHYFTALLNSSLLDFYYREISQERGRVLAQVKPSRIKALPICIGDKATQNQIVRLAKQIESQLMSNIDADVSDLKREIDKLVYTLYGLTPAEIALIEGRELSEEKERPQSPLPTTEAVGSNRFSGTGSAPPLLFTGRPPQGSFSEKMKRIETLTKQAGPAAIQELVAALSDDSDTIRWQAGAALRTIGGPQVVGVLQAFIAHSDDPMARQAARDVLEKLAI